ncbi:MAG TPA: hypothetical protein VGP48_10790 [Stellaceae bacterium]|jgi:hypothetical protein|nr:hypothetical protein [Stellaceae bacterium]
MPTQIADAPDSGFRGPFFEINPDAPSRPVHLTQNAVAAALATDAPRPLHAGAACPPAPANSSVAPLEVHEPAAGQRVDITLAPNQPLTLDFNPLDAQAVRHGDDLTLTFADGGVLVLHHIAQNGNPLPTPLQLPDGTIINPCELLQALPEEQTNPTAGGEKIPNEKIPLINPAAGPEEINPAAGPTPIIGAHPVVTPFEIPGIGNGLTPLGPLPPEGFTTTVIFPPPGNGGFPPGPPGPPGPPPPPPPPSPFLIAIEDSHAGVVPNLVDNPGQNTLTITGNFVTDFLDSGGTRGVDGAPSLTFSNPISVSTGTASGEFGTLALAANGTYTYTVNVAAEPAVNMLGSDRISEALNQQFSGAAPFLAPLEDEFVVTVTNGTQTQTELLALYIEGADATKTTTAVAGSAPATVLLTYTDLYDPAHSFSETITVNAAANTLNTDIPIQPGDPALVSLSLVSGSPVTITSIEIGGGSITVPSETLDATHHALTAIIDPQITPGTTYAVIDPAADWTNLPGGGAATAAGQYLFADGHAVTLSVAPDTAADATGVILNLGTANGVATGLEQGGLGSDTLVWNPGSAPTFYNGMAGAVVQGTATAGDTLNIDFVNAHLGGGHELVSITVSSGETTAQMAQALATAIDGDAALTALNGGHALADYGGGSSFQLSESAGSLAFGDTQYNEFASPAIFGNSPSESVNESDGLDTLQVQTSGQAIDTTNATTLAHLSNIDVVDLSGTAAGSGNNALTLSPDSVFQLTHNETSTITSFSGGANAIWILGDASDTVNLNGFVSGSNPNPMISGAVTSGAQDPIPSVVPATPVPVPGGVDVNGTPETSLVATGPTSPTQMVGFTEFTGTSSGGNTVHVYVENAIATAGHVHVH